MRDSFKLTTPLTENRRKEKQGREKEEGKILKMNERIARASKNIVLEEIFSIGKEIGVESKREIIENAQKIASDFLKNNNLTEPITLARASFFVAMKESERLTEKEIMSIIHNNGKTNRWWLYLAPLVERLSKRR